MPLERIYLTRHGHRMNWTIDHKTGTYHSNFPTRTGNPADPTLTAHGVRQSHELAAHIASEGFAPRPWRIYSSPFYRCIQTIRPSVEALKTKKKQQRGDASPDSNDDASDFDIRVENGLGEWFGSSTYFDHPSPASAATLATHFPAVIHAEYSPPHVVPSTRGETISQLHNRVATALAAIIADVDSEIEAAEARSGASDDKALLICSHAAPLIAMGRVLTGDMPRDVDVEDFKVYTAGLSTFVRRRRQRPAAAAERNDLLLAPGTGLVPPDQVFVPDWIDGKGVGGRWECVANGDCSFLSGGAERGWHFNGEESFDTGPMGPDTSNSAAKL